MKWRVAVALFLFGCGESVVTPNAQEPDREGPRFDLEPVCEPTDPAVEVGLLQPDEMTYGVEVWQTGPIATGGGVVLEQRGTEFTNSPNDLEVVWFEPTSQTIEQLTANDEDDYLMAARDGAVLIHRRQYSSGEQISEVLYRDEGGTVLLAQENSYYYSSAAVEPGGAAWVAGDSRTAFLYDGDRTTPISEGLEGSQGLSMDGGRVIWLAHDGEDYEVHLWERGARRQLTDDALDQSGTVIRGDAAFWLADGAVVRYDLLHETTETLHDGRCFAPIAVSGDKAAFLCTEPTSDAYGPIWATSTLFAYDGAAVREIPTRSRVLLSPAIDGEMIAWLEYSEGAAMCYEPEVGSVMLSRLAPDAQPMEIASITAGCYCCDAYWPEPKLTFEDGVLAWNYGVTGPDAFEPDGWWPRDAGTGYAVVGPFESCSTP